MWMKSMWMKRHEAGATCPTVADDGALTTTGSSGWKRR